jgi:phosphoribosyl-dephospho-CoA transferase
MPPELPAPELPAPQRHQLRRLTPAGWDRLLGQPWSEAARPCLAHWARHDLPLVVARQPGPRLDEHLHLGLPAPACWARQRLRLRVACAELRGLDAFPPADALAAQLPAEAGPAWQLLCEGLAALQLRAQVYGSHGWQHLTGLAYVHERSDLDLFIPVEHAQAADAVTALLAGFGAAAPRLDGELGFADGSAVAWREWQDWRAGRVDQILVKRLHSVALESGTAWLGAATGSGRW